MSASPVSHAGERGALITLEGGEGAGKSVNMAFIERWLTERAGVRPLLTREPGGTPVGEQIRRIFLEQEALTAEAELLLVFAARAQHLQQVIRPALARGDWVVSDRFTDASYAYQCGGRGIAGERVAYLEQWLQGDLRPDLTLLLDTPPDLGKARAAERGETDRFDVEAGHFYAKVRQAYRERAAAEPARIKVIDAAQPLVKVQADIADVLTQWLNDR